jgi:hypothetical protein
LLILTVSPALAGGPSVVPTAEGQLGEMPGIDDEVHGARFESIRGQPGEVLFGGLFVFGGAMPPPPEVALLTDKIHGTPDPTEVGAFPDLFANVFKSAPASARSRNAADDGDLVAFSFSVDGAMPMTMTVRVATFDETGSSLADVSIPNVNTVPDPSFSNPGVAVDDQGRATVVYTDFNLGTGISNVRAQRIDGTTGTVLDPSFFVNGPARTANSVALLDPSGSRLIIPTSDFAAIRGHIVDFGGGTPTVMPEFPISTTSAPFGNALPSVAANPATGAFFVAWEHLTGEAGNPVDVRGRRFDALGNPIGNDFVVNTTTADAQGQVAVAYDPSGYSAAVWAGDSGTFGDELDVFAQAYDPDGNPIGGEVRVNSFTENVQDRPAVRFLPEPDGNGQPQFVVAWRDVGEADGTMPRGTGTSYKCFSIGNDPTQIFTDGFESGDTTSWSNDQP